VSGDLLARITASVRARLAAEAPAADLERLRAALASPGIRVIAECKKRSPSAGELRRALDPVSLAQAYRDGGAAAISLVTERDFFAGDPAWLPAVRAAVELPLLRKDFLVTPRQLFETVLLGADAVLLVAEILGAEELPAMTSLARDLGLEVLLEVHRAAELERALATSASVIGVNARDLSTFAIDRAAAADLLRAIPADRVAVAESGIDGPAAVGRLAAAGVRSFLVGEHLLRAEDPGRAVAELVRCA
jgi:indole-3-glycerol phosphate synthase